jgi:DNA-binding GntR family transcriptional regulator
MSLDPAVLPIEPAEDSDVSRVHARLRTAILTGELRPDEPISQVRLAQTYGVSRTPLREALRLLEREGMIISERNRRSRVATLGVGDLEQIYALRITLEGFGIRLTAPMLTARQRADARILLEQLLDSAAGRDRVSYQRLHRELHLALVQHAGIWLTRAVTQLSEYAERYRVVYRNGARSWDNVDEHVALLAAVEDGDPAGAGRLLAEHLARASLTLIASTEPGHDPIAIRSALLMVQGTGAKRS